MKNLYLFLFFWFFASSSLASTSSPFDEILRFLNAFEIPKSEILEPSHLAFQRKMLEDAINYFAVHSDKYNENFNKLKEGEKKILKDNVNLLLAYGEIQLIEI